MVRSTILALAAFGLAAAGPAAAAPRAKPGRAPSAIEISNHRQVNLTEFELHAAGPDGKSVAKLSKPLAGGKKTKLALKGARGCEFVARWKFEDAGDEADVNLCNDPRIVLTD